MANVLGELFQDIADAIRSKTGETGTMKPIDFPSAISGIEGTSPDVHYVTFTNASTGETYVKPVAHGDDCVDPVVKGLWEEPTQESTAQYDYDFSGSWSATPGGAADANILKNITEDKTVYAIFTSTVRYYTITYLDDDGVTVLNTESLAYGAVPSFVPTKDGYTLSGWTPEVAPVTGNATYTAVFEVNAGVDIFQRQTFEFVEDTSQNGEGVWYPDGLNNHKLITDNYAFVSGDTIYVEFDGTIYSGVARNVDVNVQGTTAKYKNVIGNFKIKKYEQGKQITGYSDNLMGNWPFYVYASGPTGSVVFRTNTSGEPHTIRIYKME